MSEAVELRDAQPMRVWIAVDVDDVDPPEGVVSLDPDGAGPSQPFSGWLELVLVLQTLIAARAEAS
jgi:hypothetical protein